MVSILAFIHIILSIFLVLLVLIQDPKGGGAGGMFGGSGGGSNSLLGASGIPSFLAKITRWVAALFAVSCVAMTIFIKPKSESVLDKMTIPAASTIETQQDSVPTPKTENSQPE